MRTRISRPDPVRTLSYGSALFIDYLRLGIHHDHRIRGILQHLHASAKELPVAFVVMCRPFEIFPSGQLEDMVEIVDYARVPLESRIAYPFILFCVMPTNIPRFVLRRIVGNDQLEVFEILAENRIQGLSDIFLAVVDRKAECLLVDPSSHLHPPQGHCLSQRRVWTEPQFFSGKCLSVFPERNDPILRGPRRPAWPNEPPSIRISPTMRIPIVEL